MAEEMVGKVIICSNHSDWESHKSSGKVIAFFTAPWSGQAHKLSPVVRDLAMEYPRIKVLQLDMRHFQSVANLMGVEAAPTFLFLSNGNKLDKLDTPKPHELYEKMNNFLAM